jgi:hypothetical protein
MHFCPQEAAILMSIVAMVGGSGSFLGYWLRGLLKPNKHTHCEDAPDCEKEEGVQSATQA